MFIIDTEWEDQRIDVSKSHSINVEIIPKQKTTFPKINKVKDNANHDSNGFENSISIFFYIPASRSSISPPEITSPKTIR
jgi:hypothetical protein